MLPLSGIENWSQLDKISYFPGSTSLIHYLSRYSAATQPLALTYARGGGSSFLNLLLFHRVLLLRSGHTCLSVYEYGISV